MQKKGAHKSRQRQQPHKNLSMYSTFRWPFLFGGGRGAGGDVQEKAVPSAGYPLKKHILTFVCFFRKKKILPLPEISIFNLRSYLLIFLQSRKLFERNICSWKLQKDIKKKQQNANKNMSLVMSRAESAFCLKAHTKDQ